MQNLCNLVEERNLDTFYKILIAEASALPKFDSLTPKDEVLSIINSLPSTAQAMVIPLLPEKFSVNSTTKLINGNAGHSHSITLPLVPQDAALQELLDTFNNMTVVAFLTRVGHSHLYGTTAQPLLFTYDEMHATDKTGLKGYTLKMQGDTYGGGNYYAGKESEFPVLNRGLAFQLAGKI